MLSLFIDRTDCPVTMTCADHLLPYSKLS